MLASKTTAQDSARRAGPERRVRAAISIERATDGLVVGHLRVAKEHVVFVKGVVEASEGLACLFAERGGDLRIASPRDRASELRELLHDLSIDLGGAFELDAANTSGLVAGETAVHASASSATNSAFDTGTTATR